MSTVGSVLPTHKPVASWAKLPRRLSRPPCWRVHILSVGAETVQRQSAIVISARINTSAMHSPVYGVVLTLPILQLSRSVRVNTAHCQDDEPVWRLRKLLDPVAKHWLLDEAINKMKKDKVEAAHQYTDPSLPSMPLADPLACIRFIHPLLSPRDTRPFIGCHFCEAFIVQHANGKG